MSRKIEREFGSAMETLLGATLALLFVAALLACDARPLESRCNPGIDGGPAWCESTRAAAASCEECR